MTLKSVTAALAATFLAAAVIVGAGPAVAHAIILKSEPAAGSSIAGPKVAIVLQYNSRIDAARSRLVLDLPDGGKQPLTLLPQPSLDSLAANADGVAPGTYRLRWQVLSTDGHITRGEVPFRVTGP